MQKQSILYLMRHLAAREPLFVGRSVQVVGAEEGVTALVGNGIHPDLEAHLQASEYSKAEGIGETLTVPTDVKSILIYPSPLARANETARYMFIGMAKTYAKNVLGLEDITSSEAKAILSKKGLHTLARRVFCNNLIETKYKNSNGEPDDGNELVAQAYEKRVNPSFAGYKWMVQKGFENDPRSEHPKDLAERALRDIVPKMLDYAVILAASHQPNLEVITAALTGNLGKDANELWKIAGGGYDMGGGFRLTVEHDSVSKFTSANLIRTPDSKGTNFEKEIAISLDVLNPYLSIFKSF